MSTVSLSPNPIFTDLHTATLRKQIFSQCSLMDLYTGMMVCRVWEKNISDVIEEHSQQIQNFFDREVIMMRKEIPTSTPRCIWKNLTVAYCNLNTWTEFRVSYLTEKLDSHHQMNTYADTVSIQDYVNALALQNAPSPPLSYCPADETQTHRFRSTIDYYVYG